VLLNLSEAPVTGIARLKCLIAPALSAIILLIAAHVCLFPAQNPKHTGTKLEGYAIDVTSDSITVFDKKRQEIKILTDKDYTSRVGMGALVTLWYTNEGGAYHLQDIELPDENMFLPADRIRENIKRIIILPKSQDVDNTQPLFAAISQYLQDNAGWYVAPAELGAEIASRTQTSSNPLDSIDPQTGQVDMQRFLDAQSSNATKVAEEARVDAVLEIKVDKVKATVRQQTASWDDMTEVVADKKTRALAKLTGIGAFGGKGWVYAATVEMNLWSRNGKILWQKRRGFAALGFQTGVGYKYRERPLTEVYANTEAMNNWLAATLGGLARPVKVSMPEQVSPELMKQLDKVKQRDEAKQ
jgi:hypothetical protein